MKHSENGGKSKSSGRNTRQLFVHMQTTPVAKRPSETGVARNTQKSGTGYVALVRWIAVLVDGENGGLAMMKVGDIGVICNMVHATEMNGCICEILDIVYNVDSRNSYTGKISLAVNRYFVRYAYPNRLGQREIYVPFDNVRPLRDPDQEITEDEQLEEEV